MAINGAGEYSHCAGLDAPCGIRNTVENALPKETIATETFLEMPFKVGSVSSADAPAGSEGIWHRYVISQGTNIITGIRAGTHTEVCLLLQEMIERLNDRRAGRRRGRA